MKFPTFAVASMALTLAPVMARFVKLTHTTCATAYATVSQDAIPTSFYQVSTKTTSLVTVTYHATTTVTPVPDTSTQIVAETDTVTTTASQVTDTFSSTSTLYVLSTSTVSEVTTDATTFVTTSTSTSTSTVPISAGFTGIAAPPGSHKKKPQSSLAARDNPLLPPQRRLGESADVTQYPASVVCNEVTTYSTRSTSTVTASRTRTTSLSRNTVSTTITSTVQTTSTVLQPDASTTLTGYETATLVVGTTTTTSTFSTTTTATATAQAQATYYDACAPKYSYTTDLDDAQVGSDGTQTNVAGIDNAYDCCALCLEAPSGACGVSIFFPSTQSCRFFSDNTQCSAQNVAGYYNGPVNGGVAATLFNSNCGHFEYSSQA